MRREEAALALGVVGQSSRQAEQLPVDLQVDRRLVVRRRHEDGLVRRDLDAEHGRRVEIGEEHQDVVLLVAALEVLDERRAPRPLLPQPLQLVLGVWALLKIHSE